MKSLFLRLWDRRAVRILCWSVISIIILAMLLGAFVSWTGQRRWQRVKAELEAHKETLNLMALVPPAVPDRQNFGAIESLRGITLVEGRDEQSGAPGEKRRALIALGLDLPADAFPRQGIALGRAPDLAQVLEVLRKSKTLPLPAGNVEPARAIREALEKNHPLLKTLADAARTFPESELIPSLRDRELPPILFALQVPHYSVLRPATTGLRLHGEACLALGDTPAAVADALAILRFAEGVSKEPWLIGYLVASVLVRDAGELVWGILASRSAGEDDLRQIQEALERMEFEKALLQAYRMELVSAVSALEAMESSREQREAVFRVAANSKDSRSTGLFSALVPAGFFRHNKAAIVEVYWRHILGPYKEGGIKGMLSSRDEMTVFLKAHPYRPDYLFARAATPAVAAIIPQAAYTETLRRQAVLACALERYYIRNQAYPAQLGDLAPASITTLPVDVMDGAPMRYAPSQTGRYALWSTGLDQDDDGGKMPEDASKLAKKEYQGDWAWKYPAPAN